MPELPTAWQKAWENPEPQHRPLQIVHGIHLQGGQPEGVDQMVAGSRPGSIARAGMQRYRDRGLGGVVCNVNFQDYMKSQENWRTLTAAVKACQELGLIVWIYDEKGYPSGAAGGLVLQENPAYEALELAFDASREDPFLVRPAYEYTHASNNYHAARRYVNLIDDRAVGCFVEKTHEQYWRRLEPFFGNTIQAMFTDEPSLIAVNIGQIPEDARKRVTVVDPVDPNVKCLPCVPWSHDLAECYRKRYGEDLLEHRRSLFAGDSLDDRRVRRQFWSLIADLVADRYFGKLERWCQGHRIASSGHSLWEEALLHHVPLEGNGLKVLGRMHIPGLDILNSDPEAVIHNGWLTAALPASAARLGGRRRVMTEVSDFSQKMGGQGPVGLAEMRATAAWQAAWDVTDFTLYYSMGDRSADDYREYCNFVGRLNAVLKEATPIPEVLLYYPIYDLWAEYVPVAEPLKLDSQSPTARQLVASTLRMGQMLQRSQIPFTLIDHENLEQADVQADGTLSIGGRRYVSLVLSADVELPQPAAAIVKRFSQAGGRVLRDGVGDAASSTVALTAAMQPAAKIDPASVRIVLGRFTRDGREIVLVVNVGSQAYEGRLSVPASGDWLSLDPASGAVERAEVDEKGDIPLVLKGRQTRLLVGQASVR
ncbi:MAG: hypothetical protein HQ581_23445 [Planctomycetes bacterium]|nr:hypothetical protein [Planctomycetota bacterium]